MPEPLSHNIQDYLKRIYELTSKGGKAGTSQLAESLGVSAASVTNMVQKLSLTHPPYVTYQKHQGVQLTKDGEQIALKVIRRHRLIEDYLVQKLDFSWDEVHAEAEVLEHAMSPLLEHRIDAALGFPEFDPHGDPIPDVDGLIETIPMVPLIETAVGATTQLPFPSFAPRAGVLTRPQGFHHTFSGSRSMSTWSRWPIVKWVASPRRSSNDHRSNW